MLQRIGDLGRSAQGAQIPTEQASSNLAATASGQGFVDVVRASSTPTTRLA
jgi:hypothetical protein